MKQQKLCLEKNISDVVTDHADLNDLDEKGGQTNILVLDFTDESFDVSILTVDTAVFGVLLRSGDILLEGDLFYFLKCIIEYFIRLIKNRNDISKDNRALRREIEALFNKNESGISKDLTDLFRKTMRPVKKAMDDAGLGNHQIDNIVIIGGTIRFPTIKQLLLDFFDAKVPNKGMNPYEAVAYGAAGGILTKDILLYALGIETSDGVMTKVIPKNTMIPTKKSQLFTTNQDLQTTVCIQVYQGNRSLTKDCSNLGTFNLTGIPPAPRGAPRIKVTFEVDVNGTLNVKAEDMGTGKYQKITITNDKGRLSPEEIDLMVKEAEEFAEEDMEVNESNDAHNH